MGEIVKINIILKIFLFIDKNIIYFNTFFNFIEKKYYLSYNVFNINN
jgi:hypothetical protein